LDRRRQLLSALRFIALACALCATPKLQGAAHADAVCRAVELDRTVRMWVGGINDDGVVVGTVLVTDLQQYGFRAVSGALIPIDLGLPDVTFSSAEGINSLGHIVGSYTRDGKTHGYVLKQDGLTSFHAGSDDAWTRPRDINTRGTVVGVVDTPGGYRGFIFEDGVARLLTLPFEVTHSLLFGINDRGDMVGVYGTSHGDHGFLLSAEGKLEELEPPMPGAFPLGINDRGEIIGAFMYRGTDGVMQAVSQMSFGGGPFDVSNQILLISDINNSGRVAGHLGERVGGTMTGFVGEIVPAPRQRATQVTQAAVHQVYRHGLTR
jgi:uncharacterized membrane protein